MVSGEGRVTWRRFSNSEWLWLPRGGAWAPTFTHYILSLPLRCVLHTGAGARPAPQTSDRATLRHGGLCPEGPSQSQGKLEPEDRQEEPALRLDHWGLTARAA